SEVLEVGGGDLHLVLGTHPVGERREGGHRTGAQHERVVQVLLERAQVDGVLVFVGDHEAEHVDVELARGGQVAHDQFGVGGADDVWCCGHADAPNRGVWTSPSVMCTACCSV